MVKGVWTATTYGFVRIGVTVVTVVYADTCDNLMWMRKPAHWQQVCLGYWTYKTIHVISTHYSSNAITTPVLLPLKRYFLTTYMVNSGWVPTCYRSQHRRTNRTDIVMPHWETSPSAPWTNIPLSHIILILCKAILVIILLKQSIRRGSDEYQLCKSLVWLSWDSNSFPSAY